MRQEMITWILGTVAWSTIFVAVTIAVSGLVSALVALGLLEFRMRERLQFGVMREFFDQHPTLERGGFGASARTYSVEPPMETMPEGGEMKVKAVAQALGVPVSSLCRLYYRQICGQLLAAVNAETAGLPEAQSSGTRSRRRKTPLLEIFLSLQIKDPARGATGYDRNALLHRSAQQIDALQMQLGETVTRAVMKAIFQTWLIVYLIIGGITAVSVASDAQVPGLTLPGAALATFLSLFVIVLLASALAISAAACGLVAFGWLDRAVAEK